MQRYGVAKSIKDSDDVREDVDNDEEIEDTSEYDD